MSNLEDSLERIRRLQCPIDEVESRVTGILEEYNVAKSNEITIDKDEHFEDGPIKYKAHIQKKEGQKQSFSFIADSGRDDYVAQVVEVQSR
jgi:ATP-dependent RNA circularization protein (DNA/RNA ligase family)